MASGPFVAGPTVTAADSLTTNAEPPPQSPQPHYQRRTAAAVAGDVPRWVPSLLQKRAHCSRLRRQTGAASQPRPS
eukprot:5983074-Prymnesium_polylepis.1